MLAGGGGERGRKKEAREGEKLREREAKHLLEQNILFQSHR